MASEIANKTADFVLEEPGGREIGKRRRDWLARQIDGAIWERCKPLVEAVLGYAKEYDSKVPDSTLRFHYRSEMFRLARELNELPWKDE